MDDAERHRPELLDELRAFLRPADEALKAVAANRHTWFVGLGPSVGNNDVGRPEHCGLWGYNDESHLSLAG